MTPKPIPLAHLKYHWPIYGFILPAITLILLFQYYPTASGVAHSFYRWNGADISEFVGLGNYRDLLKNQDFWRSFRVALILGIWNVAKMVPAVAVAVCIHRVRSTRSQFLYRVLFVAPMVIPGLVVVLIWRSFFFEANFGYLNRFLFSTGLFNVLVWADQMFSWGGIFVQGHTPAWLGDGRLLLTACIVWGFPWVGSIAVLTHLAKLQSIPKELNEAGDVDGVSWFSRFTKIELPLMAGSINLLLVFVIIETIKDAGMILALAGLNGGPGGVVTVPALFMLRSAFIDQKMGAACAVGIVLTVIVMSLKKSLDAFADWSSLSIVRKYALRIIALLVAFAIYEFLDSITLAALVVLAVFPYGDLIGAVRSLWPVNDSPERLAQQVERYRKRRVRIEARRATEAHRRWQRVSAGLLRAMKHGFILFVLAFAYVPLYLMLIVSLKDNNQFYTAPATLTYPTHWINWSYAWTQIAPSLANSVFITISATALTLVLALMAAYFFARLRVPGSALLWNAILILMMMPTIANLVPLFNLLKSMNLLNTLTALILVGASSGQIIGVFYLRSFISDLPQDLFEAAEIDGASHFRQLFGIVAPLSGPILGVVGVQFAISQWNDYVLPLIVMRDQSRLPVMVQLLRMNGEYIKLWGPLMAGYALASLPVIVLFIATMRLFTRGLTEGAVKG